MTDQHPENNKVLHELLGKRWYPSLVAASPDCADDPRLVLEAMREREDYSRFVLWLFREYVSFEQIPFWLDGYILDRTGRLRDLAIEFLRREK